MAIWKKNFTLSELNSTSQNTLIELLNIQYTHFDEQSLVASMPVVAKTHQPQGILHGGASVVLAETVGSLAANLCVDESKFCVGLEVNANHIRSITKGVISATAKPVHLGSTTQVWHISIEDEQQNTICISRLTMAVRTKNYSACETR